MTGGSHEGRVLRMEALRALKAVDAEVGGGGGAVSVCCSWLGAYE